MGIDNETAWNYAIGMMQVDGGKPTKEFWDLVEKEKRGEITTDEMREILLRKYDKTGKNE